MKKLFVFAVILLSLAISVKGQKNIYVQPLHFNRDWASRYARWVIGTSCPSLQLIKHI
jgi:hypothetical protein